MFKAVNAESEYEKKLADLEKNRILKSYMSALKTGKVDVFLTLPVKYEINDLFYNGAKSNLLCAYIWKTPIEQVLNEVEKFNILEYKTPFFELIRKSISEESFVRVTKLINLAKVKKWTNNDYFDLKREIKKKYSIKFGKIRRNR